MISPIGEDICNAFLQKIGILYEQSRIRAVNPNWSYSLFGSLVYANKPLIVGLNWGGGGEIDKTHYDPIPCVRKEFMKMEQSDLGSLVRLKKYLERFLPEADRAYVGWTNICFFRTPTADKLPCEDIKLCIPVFLDLMNSVLPSVIIAVSHTVREHLQAHLTKLYDGKPVPLRKGCFVPARAALVREGQELPIAFLPHPACPMRSAYRDQCWEYCFSTR